MTCKYYLLLLFTPITLVYFCLYKWIYLFRILRQFHCYGHISADSQQHWLSWIAITYKQVTDFLLNQPREKK